MGNAGPVSVDVRWTGTQRLARNHIAKPDMGAILWRRGQLLGGIGAVVGRWHCLSGTNAPTVTVAAVLQANAEKILVRRLAEMEKEARRHEAVIFTFEEAGLRYLEEIAHKSSARTIAMKIDQLFPFIGTLPIAQVHDGTIRPFFEHEQGRGMAPKTINNVLVVVSTVLNRAARVWRDKDGNPWLTQAPALISRLSVKGKQAKAYPLSWSEQDRLIKELPRHLADAALFGLNTGCREQEICKLRWDWEVQLPEMETSVFILGASITKTSTERVVVLNAAARRVIESRRGIHAERVFTYRDRPVGKLRSSA